MPHFEKMLYDNPQLVMTYLDAYRLINSDLTQLDLTTHQGVTGGVTSDTGGTAGGEGSPLDVLASAVQLDRPGDSKTGVSPAGAEGRTGAAGGHAGLSAHGEEVVQKLEQQRLQFGMVVRGVLDYLRRDMTHPEGGLFSAEVRGPGAAPRYSRF